MQQTCGQIFLIGNLSKNVGLPHRLNCYYRTFQNFTKASLWIQIFVRIEKKITSKCSSHQLAWTLTHIVTFLIQQSYAEISPWIATI